MFKNIIFGSILLFGLMLAACAPTGSAGDTAPQTDAVQSEDTIPAAALAGLEAIGWDITGFEAETEIVDGNFARVTVHATNPPGGFTAFLQRVNGEWMLLTQGSAFNPADLQAMGIPDSVLGPWSSDGGDSSAPGDDIDGAALAGLEAIGWDITGFQAEVRAVEGDYANVTITSTNPPGGFTAFMMRQNGAWTVAVHGSAYNPEELQAMGFPDSVLK